MEIKLSYAPDSPPLAVIAVAKVAGIPISTDATLPSGSPPTILSDGKKLQGANELLRYLGGLANSLKLYSPDVASQIDQWLDYVTVFSSGPEFEGACAYADKYLLHRTFLVGYSLTIADLAIWSCLAGTGLNSLRKSKKYPNLVRWFNSILSEYEAPLDDLVTSFAGKRSLVKSSVSKVKETQSSNSRVDNGSTDANKKEMAPSQATYEVELPDAEVGKLRVRFAPEPSGYLHIGHTKAALLNKYFADKYQGQLIVRMDDTNPDKENNEFVDNLLKDIDTLGIRYETVTYTSDYFPKLMEMAEKMIREGKAYVDDTPREQIDS